MDDIVVAAGTMTERVADAFVFRRVSDGHYAHVGGLGRGEAWAGIVSFVVAESPETIALPEVGGVHTTHDGAPRHRFGPYWSTFFVVVRVAPDVLVAFGGPDEVAATDADWHTSATALAARLTHVSPAKRLADELELLHAVRDVALIPPGPVAQVGDRILHRLAAGLSCEAAVLVFADGTVCVHVAPDAGVSADTARTTLVQLAAAHRGTAACRQQADADGPSWLRSYLVRPVGTLATVVLAHTSAAPRGFTELCQDMADSVSATAATVLQAAGQHEAARRRADVARAEARRDALTGVGNRRAWDDAVAAAAAGPAAVIVCDLDGLKEVNDCLGHAAGDDYLRTTARTLQDVVAADTLVARIGGDEFVVLLPGADATQAQQVVTRIRRACRGHHLPDGRPVSVAVGMAVGDGADLPRLLGQADATMYRRKRSGALDAVGGVHVVRPEVVQPVVSAVLRGLLHLPPDQADDGIDHALRILGQSLGLDRAYLFALQGQTMSNTHEWCAPGISAEKDRLQDLPIELISRWLEPFGDGVPVHVPDVAALPAEQAEVREVLRTQKIKSLLMVPTMFRGEVVGFIGLDAVRRRHVFDDEAQALLALVADIVAAVDARRRASHRVELAEDRAAELLRHSRDYLVVVDTSGHVTWASQSFLQAGVDPKDLLGRPASRLTHPEDAELVRQLVGMWLRTAQGGELVLPDHRIVIAGQSRWVSVVIQDARTRPGIEGLIVAAHDVTERREQAERLRHQALHDDLTGLPNRALLKDRLEVALHRAARNAGHVGVLFLGLDGFKMVNDSRSHAVGDQMLRQIADRLRQAVRHSETAGRFGGDQFVVVIESDTPDQIHQAVERITAIFGPAFTMGGQTQSMSASFGLRVSEAGELDPDAVLRDADNALFSAKSRGRGRLVAFDPLMRERAVRQDDVARRLPEAIAKGQVAVHYQPIVDLATGRALGAEALARWTDPELGEVGPTEFIPVAEQSGLIGVLGEHVLRQACLEAVAWPDDVYVSVNLSPSQLEDADLTPTVVRALADTGLPPHRLVLEVTESLLMRDTERSIDHLVRLQATGIRVALDDFGTGHSSLAILRDLPLDILKIDRSFVVRMQRDDRGARMVDGIVSLADDLGLVTVAEGVETPSQAARLRQAGCGLAQGWLFGHAVPDPVFVAPQPPEDTLPSRPGA